MLTFKPIIFMLGHLPLQTAYIDVCDDQEYSIRAKGYHDQAVAAQVPAITTAGIYPGVSNSGSFQRIKESLLCYCLPALLFQVLIT